MLQENERERTRLKRIYNLAWNTLPRKRQLELLVEFVDEVNARAETEAHKN
jgi:hypothetical protein